MGNFDHIIRLLYTLCWISVAIAVPAPKCSYGYGTTCGTEKNPKKCNILTDYPPARRGDCARCERTGCALCDSFDSKCSRCLSGYASIADKSCNSSEFTCFSYTCVKCMDENCGDCHNDPKKCESYPLQCEIQNSIEPATNAKEIEWEGNIAVNRLGMDGNGYTWYYHAWIKNNTCMDCLNGLYIGENRPDDFKDTEFLCGLYERALKVAANAWKNVRCKDQVQYKLVGWRFGPYKSYPLGDRNVHIITESSCMTAKGTEKKLISSAGGYTIPKFFNIVFQNTNKWTWAEAPSPVKGGGCIFEGEYNLTPESCPSFQIVTDSRCKRTKATMANGIYFSRYFTSLDEEESLIPIWNIEGNSSSATLRSIKKCKKSVLSVESSSSSTLDLVAKKDTKGRSTSFGIEPITPDGPCTEVHLTRTVTKDGNSQVTEYLTAGSDCVRLKWRSDPTKRSIFKLEKRCSIDQDKTYSCGS